MKYVIVAGHGAPDSGYLYNVWENGISLTVMDYTDALRIAGVYPSEYGGRR